jgi:hypothetical protein
MPSVNGLSSTEGTRTLNWLSPHQILNLAALHLAYCTIKWKKWDLHPTSAGRLPGALLVELFSQMSVLGEKELTEPPTAIKQPPCNYELQLLFRIILT